MQNLILRTFGFMIYRPQMAPSGLNGQFSLEKVPPVARAAEQTLLIKVAQKKLPFELKVARGPLSHVLKGNLNQTNFY